MLIIPKPLISKYSVSVPRYTSYPTAVEFQSDFREANWKDLIEKTLSDSTQTPISIYVHVPFCPKLCYFCACNKIITTDKSVTTNYLAAVYREIENYSKYFGSHPLYQVHWGGGSPNFLNPEEMIELHGETLKRFPYIDKSSEVSVELDPRTTSIEQLEALKEVGFNRVSFGVQDFDELVQRTINRVQTFEQTKELGDQSRKLGFGGLNLDLIYGLPNQTLKGFSKTLDLVNQIRPDRIALYGYAHVTWIHKVQKSFERAVIPTPEDRIELFHHAVEKLSTVGYRHIGLDHFALPTDDLSLSLDNGSLHRNFMGYTTKKGTSLLGFGASSISTLKGGSSQNEKNPALYQKRISEGSFATVKGYVRTNEDLWRSEVIEQILCSGVVKYGEIREQYPWAKIEGKEGLAEFEADGLVKIELDGFRLTELGRYFSRNIASSFDEYLNKHTAKKTFSQAV